MWHDSTYQARQMKKQSFSDFWDFWELAQYRFYTVGTDHIASIVASPRRNKYLVAAIDRLTKLIETEVITAPTAASAAGFFVEQVGVRHGVDTEWLLLDTGTYFTAA